MNKLLVLACFLVSISANAQTAPKVVFTGDQFTLAWQQTPQFTANQNWIGAGVQVPQEEGSGVVEAAFQANVINQHPAFVHIMTGTSDIWTIKDSTPLGVVWNQWQQSLVQMVDMAQKAGIKVILGTVVSDAGGPYGLPNATQLFNAWLAEYGLANNIPVVNYHDALCQCVGSTSPNDTFAPSLSVPLDLNNPSTYMTPNAAGYALISQMAQTAIATYSLKLKGGYLSNVQYFDEFNNGEPLQSQLNSVAEGQVLIFTPQAIWSDGVTRPIQNSNYNGSKGTWTSSDPSVMYISPEGYAYAYKAGSATISYKASDGTPFSPWVMAVETIYGVI